MTIFLILCLLWQAPKTTYISVEEIRRTVERFVPECKDASTNSIAIEFRTVPNRIPLPRGAYILRVLADNTAPLRGNLSFALEVVGDGEKGRRFTVPVRIRTFGTVAISQKQLPKHAPITDDDLLFRSVETTTLSTDVITKREQLIGKRTKRIVSEGSVLSESVFESHPLVELNQFVTLMVRHGAVALSTKAVAKEDGRKGDIITVQLVDSHQRLRARVIDDQTLELVPK